MTIENCFTDNNKLRLVFSWLTRIGASPKFGSRPIGWYQAHQCACIDWIKENIGMRRLRAKAGFIEFHKDGKWQKSISIRELFDIADKKCRS